MRRYAEAHVRRNLAAQGFDLGDDGPRLRKKALLPRLERLAPEARPAVERRQQRDRDAARARRLEVAHQHPGRVMDVVEFADGGVTVLQHLDIELRRDCPGLLRGDALDE